MEVSQTLLKIANLVHIKKYELHKKSKNKNKNKNKEEEEEEEEFSASIKTHCQINFILSSLWLDHKNHLFKGIFKIIIIYYLNI